MKDVMAYKGPAGVSGKRRDVGLIPSLRYLMSPRTTAQHGMTTLMLGASTT